MKKRRQKKKSTIWLPMLFLFTLAIAVAAAVMLYSKKETKKPAGLDELLVQYMGYVEAREYEKQYAMTDSTSRLSISAEDFTERNKRIYEGIEAADMKITITRMEEEKDQAAVYYETEMDSLAGSISFANEAVFIKEEGEWKLSWHDSLIFPGLAYTDKVRVSVKKAARGDILDRNKQLLAGEGTASSVGLVPGKMKESPDQDLEKLAELLEMPADRIRKKLDAGWVKADSLVPLKTIPKADPLAVMKGEAMEQDSLQEALLSIPGVMISDEEVRVYPLGEKASHLTGYIQNVTAEDLEKNPGKGYTADSIIGKSGMEGLYEDELKGKDGCEIYIVDEEGRTKHTLASVSKEDGTDIVLTIDAGLQEALYDQFSEDQSCSVAMNPYTGEVLALVSTPSFDSNDFVFGLSDAAWTALNEDEAKPMLNRFRQRFCPGSSFKPVMAGIGLSTGILEADRDYGNEGLSWQEDTGWGSYKITTLHAASPAVLENAIVQSDNIYFAKAALLLGADRLAAELGRLGFREPVPFEISVARSQYANEDDIKSRIQLADSGYGQGEILMNPLHLAALYTAFLNEGDAVRPVLRYQDNMKPVIWLPEAFTREAAGTVKTAMEKVVNDPKGTGYAAHREDILLGGKTGTAEIKLSKEDMEGTELGWFCFFTADPLAERPVLLVSMAEGVKNKGGSGYVVKKSRAAMDQYIDR